MSLDRRALLALAAGGAAGALGLAGCGGEAQRRTSSGASATGSATASPTASPTVTATASATPGTARGTAEVTGTVTTGIDTPWGLALLPGGDVLMTSRDDFGVYRLAMPSGRRTLVGRVSEAVSNQDQGGGEGGLLGIAVSPGFASDRLVYVYYSTADDNRIARMTYGAGGLGPRRVIVRGIPHNVHHNGGRLAFGPDGMLYASTGEAQQEQLAQDRASLGGKVLRMRPDGSAAPGNPFGSRVWSLGHRNVQGLAFDPEGRLFAGEFGDKEADELNLIRRGANYGWPQTQGRTSRKRFTSPVAQWGTDEDSPSGIAWAAGCIWMAALQGERLWRIPMDGARTVAEPRGFLRGEHGRLRSVLALDDATLLVTTSNRDGRTTPRAGDDRVLRVAVT